MTQPSRRTPPTSSQAKLSATSSRGQVDKTTKSTSSTSSSSSTSKTGDKKPAGKAGPPPTEDNPKSTSSTSKTGAKKPAGKAGHPPAKDNTKLYIGIGVGGGLLLLLIVIACCMEGDKEAAPVQAVAAAPTKAYDPLEPYKKMSVSERKNVYREGCAIDEKVAAEMAKIPMTGDRTKDMKRHNVEAGIQGKLEAAVITKFKLNRQSYDKINSDGVNNHWK